MKNLEDPGNFALGKYELRERLGQGGMAQVWKAFDTRLQRYVAIKFLHSALQNDPTFLARFEREARAIASLRHPNIVQVYDFEISASENEESLAYMVMDYIEGPTLTSYLYSVTQANTLLSPQEVVFLFYTIGEAIDYAHRHGLLHRDIKPSNILLDRRNAPPGAMGEPILSDFGLVKILGSAAGTLTSSALGTPAYISPEQAMGKTATSASDIYSLGVLLYEVCTGALPFTSATPVIMLQQHAHEPVPAPEKINPAISPELAAVILRCLEKEPEARYASAHALAEALSEALDIPLPKGRTQPISSPDIRSLVDSGQLTITYETEGVEEAPSMTIARAKPEQAESDPLTPAPVKPHITQTLSARGILSVRVPSSISLPEEAKAQPQQTPLAPRPPVRRRPRRGLLLIALAGLLLLLSASGLTIFLYMRAATSSSAPGAQVAGSAFFASSGAADGAQNLGINDIFQFRLTNVPAPEAGQRYYAWLLPDLAQSEANPRALGPLTVSSGVATLPTPYIDPQHENLFGRFSRFLVTEEPEQPAPQSPSLNTALWRYYAQIPQSPPLSDCASVINQLSVLCHLRHLLASDPELTQVNLQGGLDYRFLSNVRDVQKWAIEGMDHTDPTDVRHKMANILYILDGRSCIAQDLAHAAPGFDNTPDDGALSTIAALPLLSCAQTPDVPGLLAHIHNHLNAMLQSQGVQSSQVALATQIATELNAVGSWLTTIQNDARQLLSMNNQQLAQSSSLRDEIDMLATNTLSGGTDPTSGMLDKGVASISNQIQQLATMTITAYHKS